MIRKKEWKQRALAAEKRLTNPILLEVFQTDEDGTERTRCQRLVSIGMATDVNLNTLSTDILEGKLTQHLTSFWFRIGR